MMQLKAIYMLPGETQIVLSDWTAECEQRGTTVSSSAWDAGNLTLSGAALIGNVPSVLVSTADQYGATTLINTATLANGEVLKSEREVIVREW